MSVHNAHRPSDVYKQIRVVDWTIILYSLNNSFGWKDYILKFLKKF